MPPPIPTGAKTKAMKKTPNITSIASMILPSMPTGRCERTLAVAVDDVVSCKGMFW